MFVQVIQGQVSDAGQARAALDRWVQELAPGAPGWLGSTAGVTEDGRFIALARFESEEAAKRNSDRPGQDLSEWSAFRPDNIGGVGVGHAGGAYTMALYFTSEEAAREGERKEPPPELKAQMDEMAALSVGVPEFFDLKQPWLYSPR